MAPQMGMQGMPGGAMQMPRPNRRGAPKIVPVIVSAGLAVGVFCGLLFGLGTGKEEANAATAKPKAGVMSDDSAAPEGLGATSALPAPSKTAPAPAPAPAPAAGSGSAGSATAAAPTIKTVKLTVNVKPDAASKDAKIVVDGKEITGTSVDLPAEKKSVKVSVTSNGFHSYEKTIDLSGDETSFDVEMLKRGGGGAASPGFGGASHTAPTVPKAPPGEPPPPKKKKGGGGGVIDI
jgi:hypothetical protein